LVDSPLRCTRPLQTNCRLKAISAADQPTSSRGQTCLSRSRWIPLGCSSPPRSPPQAQGLVQPACPKVLLRVCAPLVSTDVGIGRFSG
jgi:hypothetical protein